MFYSPLQLNPENVQRSGARWACERRRRGVTIKEEGEADDFPCSRLAFHEASVARARSLDGAVGGPVRVLAYVLVVMSAGGGKQAVESGTGQGGSRHDDSFTDW